MAQDSKISDGDCPTVVTTDEARRADMLPTPKEECGMSENRIEVLESEVRRWKWSRDVHIEQTAHYRRRLEQLESAMRGDPEVPEISPLSWLRSMIDECKARGPSADNDDPDAFWEMVREVEALHTNATAALEQSHPESKERGERVERRVEITAYPDETFVLPEIELRRDDYRKRKDDAYEERNRVVALLARMFPSGTKRTDIPGWDAEWHGCVYIDLPTGQVSWHYHDSQAHLFADLPPYKGEWDGHDTPEKYRRIEALKETRGVR